jgi:hypothetical protein
MKGTPVKVLAIPVMVAAGLAAAAAGLAGSAGADSWEPTPPTSPFPGSAPSTDKADVVVNNLKSSNYRVILNKIGTASLDKCTVTSVTPGQAIITPVTGGAKGITQQVLFTTVYVTADCTTPTPPTTPSAAPSGG